MTTYLFDASVVIALTAQEHVHHDVVSEWAAGIEQFARLPLSHSCYDAAMRSVEPQVESLSQRELRNESGRVLRAVSQGRSFVLTNSGVPVGRIVPLDAPAPGLTIARPARREGGWAALAIPRKVTKQSLAATLDDLREDRL